MPNSLASVVLRGCPAGCAGRREPCWAHFLRLATTFRSCAIDRDRSLPVFARRIRWALALLLDAGIRHPSVLASRRLFAGGGAEPAAKSVLPGRKSSGLEYGERSGNDGAARSPAHDRIASRLA